ncbi:MAG: EAL domain-containing protein [Actinomycetota bacterium]|nr:EAL domain-containing protein [Actinomycetota bacterium]
MTAPARNAVDGTLSVDFEPILDLDRGIVAGYRACSRGRATLRNDDVRIALAARSQVPANCFLSVAVAWEELAVTAVRSSLLRPSSLAGVIVDVVDLSASVAAPDSAHVITEVQAAGALVALHAADLWTPEFAWWSRLHPAVIVLDSAWTHDIAASPRLQSAVAAIGHAAADLDAWMLAAKIDNAADLAAVRSLGVPLACGAFVGPRASAWPGISPGAIRATPPRPSSEPGPLHDVLTVALCVYTIEDALRTLERAARTRHVVVVDRDAHAGALVVRGGDGQLHTRSGEQLLRANIDTPAGEIWSRALARPKTTRTDPVTVIDNAGRLLGLVTVAALATLVHAAAAPPETLTPDVRWSTIVDTFSPARES